MQITLWKGAESFMLSIKVSHIESYSPIDPREDIHEVKKNIFFSLTLKLIQGRVRWLNFAETPCFLWY